MEKLSYRSPDNQGLNPMTSNPLPDPPPLMMKLGNSAESNSLISDVLTEKTVPESRAIVPVPPVSPRALSTVQMNQKGRRTDVAQRRIRRPFSVSEVEALVQAVEELGTGRYTYSASSYRLFLHFSAYSCLEWKLKKFIWISSFLLW